MKRRAQDRMPMSLWQSPVRPQTSLALTSGSGESRATVFVLGHPGREDPTFMVMSSVIQSSLMQIGSNYNPLLTLTWRSNADAWRNSTDCGAPLLPRPRTSVGATSHALHCPAPNRGYCLSPAGTGCGRHPSGAQQSSGPGLKSRRIEPLDVIEMTFLVIGTASRSSRQRVLCPDQGVVPDRDLRFDLPRLAPRRAAAHVLHQPPVRRRRRPRPNRVVERALAISEFQRCAAFRDHGLGACLPD